MNKRMPKKVIVIGFGSIGKRHARNLIELGIVPYIVTRHPDPAVKAVFFSSMKEIKDPGAFTHAIIASPTARHLDDMRLVAKAGIKNVLIEKPIEATSQRAREILKLAKAKRINVSVAYNMRYCGSLRSVKDFVKKNMRQVRIVEALVGHYLPLWRPGWDYAASYRARRKSGGGVDLDLSHEVDYVLWLFGDKFKARKVHSAKISDLKIDAPDITKVILDYGKMIADITLDCIRRPKERRLNIICENGKRLSHDFMTNTLTSGNKKVSFKDDMVNSYKKMLKGFLGTDKKKKDLLCTGDEALQALKVLGT